DSYMQTFLATDWEVHFNSSRTGVRLIGPKPEWVRESGGEAGLHPSNIHDNPYAIGAVDFTGDMPVILGPDGPSLGGFVCPVTIIEADLWQLGQLKAGDKVRFVPVDIATARELARARREECALVSRLSPGEEPGRPAIGVRDVSTDSKSPSPQPSPGGRGSIYAQSAEYALTSPIVLDLGQDDTR